MPSALRNKSRYVVVLGFGLILGSVLVPPVTAHVNEKFGHLWGDHIKPRLSADGTVNASGNPVSWSQLKDVPAGFADGVDASQDGSNGRRTFVTPHVFETKGIARNEPNATDFEVKVRYARGVPVDCTLDQCPGARVSLYLYDESGEPMRGADASTGAGTVVCNPCTRTVGMSTVTATFSLQDLITKAGGFAGEVQEGFGVIVVDGSDPGGVSIQGFVVNSHTNPFDFTTSYPQFEEVLDDEVTDS